MAELIWYSVGAALVVAGGLLLAVWVRRPGRHHRRGQPIPQTWSAGLPEADAALAAPAAGEEHVGWEGHLAELAELSAPTEVMPAVPYRGGRHSYPGRPAPTSGYQPRHDADTIGWRTRPAGWTPPVGAARLAAEMDATQVQPPVVEP